VPAERKNLIPFLPEQQFYQLEGKLHKEALLATVVHHKYLLHADKIHIKKQSMM
jgi:hypothetical protein